MFVPLFVSIPVSVAGAVLATDFVSGTEDTWTAPGRFPLLDRYIIRDNIEHHRTPGSIRGGSYWVTNGVCIVLALCAAAIAALAGVHIWQVYLVIALASQSNQVHKWAHMANPPRVVAWFQRIGLLQSTKHHARHHARPYASRYCSFTNYLNPLLDGIHFWRGLEFVIVRCGGTVQRATPARGGY